MVMSCAPLFLKDGISRWSTRVARIVLPSFPVFFIGRSDEDSHAFVQVLDGVTGQVEYHRYPIGEFHAPPDTFDFVDWEESVFT